MVRTEIDWMACELIERIPGKVSGRPIVRGTRICPMPLLTATLSVEQIKRLIEFAHAHRGQALP